MKDAGELQKKSHMKRSSIQKLPKALLRNRGEVYEFYKYVTFLTAFCKENAKLILEDMSLQVEEGEFISILYQVVAVKQRSSQSLLGYLIQLMVLSF